MTQSITNNLASMNARGNLRIASDRYTAALQRLSSGLRINSASDDSAGLAVATGIRSIMRGNSMALRNINDGISMMQTADIALGDAINRLQRIRDIAISSTNNSITDTQRDKLQTEVNQLTQGISSIVQTTQFNGQLLLSGNELYTFQAGASGRSDNQITLSIQSMTGIVGFSSDLTASGVIDVSSFDAASAVISAIDESITTLSVNRGNFGSLENRFWKVVDNLGWDNGDLSSALDRIESTDYGGETERMNRYKVIQDVGTAILAQANVLPQTALSLLR
jgi:flagellin